MQELNIENFDYNGTNEDNDSLCMHIFNNDYTDYQTKVFKQNNFNSVTKFYNSFVYDIQNDKFYHDNSPNVNKKDSLKFNLCDLIIIDGTYNVQLNKTNDNTNYTFNIYVIVDDINKEIDLTRFNFNLVDNGKVSVRLIKQTEHEYKEIDGKEYTLIFNKNYKYINTKDINTIVESNEKQEIEENELQDLEEVSNSFINFDVIFENKDINGINKSINPEISIKYDDNEIYYLENFLKQNKKYKKSDYIVKLDYNCVYRNVNEFKKFIEINKDKKNIINLDDKQIERIEKQIASNKQIDSAIRRFPNGCIAKWIGNNNEYKVNSICNFNVLAERYAIKKYDIEDIMKVIVCNDDNVKRVYATALWKRGLEIEFNKSKPKNDEITITNSEVKMNDDIQETAIINDVSTNIVSDNENIDENKNKKDVKKRRPVAVVRNKVNSRKRGKKYNELIKTTKGMANNLKEITDSCREILEEDKNMLRNLDDALEQTEMFELSCPKKR